MIIRHLIIAFTGCTFVGSVVALCGLIADATPDHWDYALAFFSLHLSLFAIVVFVALSLIVHSLLYFLSKWTIKRKPASILICSGAYILTASLFLWLYTPPFQAKSRLAGYVDLSTLRSVSDVHASGFHALTGGDWCFTFHIDQKDQQLLLNQLALREVADDDIDARELNRCSSKLGEGRDSLLVYFVEEHNRVIYLFRVAGQDKICLSIGYH